MKEKDLEKCLDNLIIKGLIQEAEQDNAEFEAAMRNMSDEDFLALIYDTVEEPTIVMENESIINEKQHMDCARRPIMLSKAQRVSGNWDERDAPDAQDIPKKSNIGQKGWKVWTAAIASVAAILLIVFVPAHTDMNSRLCESALLATNAYISPLKGIEISSMEKNEVKNLLPELEKQYSISTEKSKGILSAQIKENSDSSYYLENVSPREAGIDLVQAYLKLGMKDRAVKVLHELESNDEDPDFREYCQKMLEILE